MDSGDIHWGLVTQARGVGGTSSAFIYWNLVLTCQIGPLVSLTPPVIPPPGIVSCRLSWGKSFYTTWAPHSSGGPRGAAMLRPSHVESSSDSTWTQPRLSSHTLRTPLSLSAFLHTSSPPPSASYCSPPQSGCRPLPNRGGIKNYIFFIGIGPIFNKELIFSFNLLILFVRFIEDTYKYYKTNIIYTHVLGFFTMLFIYNGYCVLIQTQKYFSVLLVLVLFCIQSNPGLVTTIKSQFLILSTDHRTAEQSKGTANLSE